MQRILITGGAGFIGSHVAELALARNFAVRVIDNLTPQVHGEDRAIPEYLRPDVDLVQGDLRDPEAVARSLRGVDAVIHLASAVGVGQSMYQIADYVGTNDLGTAVLLEALIAQPVRRLVVASSMSIYGEGMAARADGSLVEPAERPTAQLRRGIWENLAEDGSPLAPVPTPEGKQPVLGSVYALTKFTQERLALIFGRNYDVPTTALRFFNVYGPHQALSNPYTGVIAIFASRLMNGRPPMIFEDGRQQRDFVHVRDVARACLLAIESDAAAGQAINVGSGRQLAISEIATILARVLGRTDLQPHITGRYRAGDIRHCFADTTRAETLLGFKAEVEFEAGLRELAEWLSRQQAVDRVDAATDELMRRGLVA
jgi:dTDP-L-rhamnose 4-epimerase